MIDCPYCGEQNREGTLFCEECGQTLFGDKLSSMTATRQLQNVPDELGLKATWGTARFSDTASVVIHIRDAEEPIELHPLQDTSLGRRDPNAESGPTIDLSPYDAIEKGVSRMHAAIRRGEDTLTLIDLGSVNGTYLNGQRLTPNQPRVLRDGDEMRLGQLVIHVYFI